jgi:hypothetical protein
MSRKTIAILTLLLLLVVPAGAAQASTASMSVSVSPPSTIGGEFSDNGSGVVLTISTNTPKQSVADVELPTTTAPCVSEPNQSNLVYSSNYFTGELNTTKELAEINIPEKRGTYHVCGYVKEQTFGSYGEWPVIARAETTLTVTESREEIYQRKLAQEAAERKAHQEATEAREREQYAQELAKERAEREAQARTLDTYLTGVAQRGHCESLSEQYRSQVANCEAKEKAIHEQQAREWTALEAVDLAKPITKLSVKAIARLGHSSEHPGLSVLRITTDPFAYVMIKLHRYGHTTERLSMSPSSMTDSSTTTDAEYDWTCKRPGGVYTYVVTARTNVGTTLTRKGRFKPVSAARCHALKRYEREARERSARAYGERIRHEREAEEATQREGEFNCRQRGGTVVQLYVEGEPRLGCRSPLGGLIPWIP